MYEHERVLAISRYQRYLYETLYACVQREQTRRPVREVIHWKISIRKRNEEVLSVL